VAFDPASTSLPIVDIIPAVQQHLEQGSTLIVHAPPGAGKSTVLPLTLLGANWLNGQKIIMLEPRRLAAKTIAMRMADLLGEAVGKTIGYRIRFETKVSKHTQIEVVTEGILTRMLHSDNALEGVGIVVFDEFHERSIHADVALALCRESQQILRQDLRILIMSATLNLPELTALLQAPAVESQGRQYPVDVRYVGEQDRRLLPELTTRTVIKAMEDETGDVLVFLPGQGEIKKCEEILRKALPGVAIHPLYGQLPPGKQFAAIMPNREGKRKVVLATSIAETSLTIEGISIVVDSGFGRTSRFDPKTGLSRLETVQVSKDSADQRAGRAGRLGPGICYRMWTPATQHRLAAHRTPEILEADLASLVLDMTQWGIVDVQQMTWLTPPPKGALSQAFELLHELQAVVRGKLTEHGKRMHALPCHPRIAHLLLFAEEEELLGLATDVSAILEERDPLPREVGIDINLRVEALRRHRKEKRNDRGLSNIDKVADSYRKLFEIEPDNTPINPFETGLLLAKAYPERIAHARPGNNAQFKMANGKLAMAGHKDDLAYEQWLAVAHVDPRDGMGKIFMAAPLNPRDLAPFVEEKDTIEWDTDDGGLSAARELRIGSIVLQSKPLPDPDPALLKEAVSDAVAREGEQLLPFDTEVTQWQNRVLSLRKWRPTEDWPDVSTPALLFSNKDWLGPYLDPIRKPGDLKKLDLLKILQYSLTYEQQQTLDKLAPKRFQVPSGSQIRLLYQANGGPPVLAVRLQEVFGLADTPTVNEEKVKVLMHLLSPASRPVQVTSDLKNFWDNTYFDVKKELKSRYPKHAWPDNPWEAEAIRGTKKRK